MPEPIFTAIAAAIATAVSGKTTEAALKAGHKASKALVALVKEKFSREPSAQAALDAAVADPEKSRAGLAKALELLAEMDPEFAERLTTEYQRGEPRINASSGAVVNSNHGQVHGNLIQGGHVEYREG